MTAPYFSADGVALYLSDCREVTAWLEADLLVTDPPYGIAWSQGELGHGTRHGGIAGDKDTSVRDEVLKLWGDRPAAWQSARIDRAGRYRHPQLHDEVVAIKDISRPVRQIAVRNIGREEPTLLITCDRSTKAEHLFARYAERMLIENELSAYIKGFHLDALSSGLALNVDLDTTLSVIAGNLYRLFGRSLKRYEHMTPERLYDQFVDTTGTLHVGADHVTVELTRRTWTPVLLQAGFAEMDLPIPWWGGRGLRFRFP